MRYLEFPSSITISFTNVVYQKAMMCILKLRSKLNIARPGNDPAEERWSITVCVWTFHSQIGRTTEMNDFGLFGLLCEGNGVPDKLPQST